MRYDWMDAFLMDLPAVTKDLQPEWNWIRYHIGGRMFAAILLDDADAPVYVNVKVEPLEGEFLRGQYADIIPGYYSNKQHWISVMPDGEVPDELLRGLLTKARLLVLRGFPKAKQREILGVSSCGTDCSACPMLGDACPGCNAAKGRVFHAPQGKACPLHACAAGKKRLATCADCEELPCGLWRATRDPSLSDEAFEQSIADRVARLRRCMGDGV